MTAKVVDASDYRLEFHYEAPRLTARIVGGRDTGLAVSSAYWLRIAEELRAAGASELLVIDGLQGEVMTNADLERFFALIDGSGLDRARIAYVEARMDQMPRIEFAELMARERGYTIRMFGNETDAAIWLRHGMA
ncbi:hypothetical protein [Thermomonas sp. HDW16]|uniref:hypothetical protein n=1 Tax=Thermomonas sp. HDW16 TaxID=2714945 RepID=UPI00140AF15D|nr:hypothetical protein [Thermomonas sp. HDW16]QIL20462.1 hypothetical protein G7079_06780 [Thermomonas sp. HDW16]